ncbi:CDP-alcohol phosphatidyltransferase family protein [Winogradskyella aurantia]|uniref:CDP-alcohol phosphatidyltransferase n=1 Tax=Winogradskyella aurantia TaxID=1915063 RepID=A0A265URP2_9FLAO|nr:CDP-alcohol phosphatidyltransferase family protein [Winogradskyella aurantia]OZV67983.1 CDP-alcohol phosphatidyltransferase [Winogradskyella aurantia]
MSKLPKKYKFVDLSDYGRPIAKVIANQLKNTSFTPIHVTIAFIISGLIAIYCIIQGYFWLAAFFLLLKSILDAADGELARVKQKPSYTGRYLDSVADIILNALFLFSLWYITDTSLWLYLLAFIGLQLQGTLYNYYYVILRTNVSGDTTSRVFENKTPIALEGEKQKHVNILFGLYKLCYGAFDKTIYAFDSNAPKGIVLPNWLMTSVSTFGLGFQLLVIAVMLVLDLKAFILPFFSVYSVMIFVFIGIRKFFFQDLKGNEKIYN